MCGSSARRTIVLFVIRVKGDESGFQSLRRFYLVADAVGNNDNDVKRAAVEGQVSQTAKKFPRYARRLA